ncbi:MAG: acyl carrier protein phosphodiesterase [Paraglaciecola sp.]|jgi:acyl carrier protein phosphodiesterase
MNYIAHIHIAQHTNTSMVGNFLGDFVKGSELGYLPTALESGIRLHRSVDVFTDQHPGIVELKNTFPANIRRMAGIAIDIYFDHLLLQHWQAFSKQAYQQTLASFYQELQACPLAINPRYAMLRGSLLQEQWLEHYIDVETCLRAFKSIEARLHNRVTFAQQASEFLQQKQQYANQIFLDFYPDLLRHARYYCTKNR